MSQQTLKVGDKVTYKVGQGLGKGVVKEVSTGEGTVVIETRKGKIVSRTITLVQKDNS